MPEISWVFDVLHKGGWVAWVLAIMSGFLWYAIGYRYLFLKSQYLGYRPESLLKMKSLEESDLLGEVVSRVNRRLQEKTKDIETAMQFEFQKFSQIISVHSQTIRSIVLVAPLLGLLGTVIGMIETFDSLQDAALFSQSGGVAGGISQALITTQMGLVVAIPGLLIGKKLDQKQERLTASMENLMSAVQLRGDRQ